MNVSFSILARSVYRFFSSGVSFFQRALQIFEISDILVPGSLTAFTFGRSSSQNKKYDDFARFGACFSFGFTIFLDAIPSLRFKVSGAMTGKTRQRAR